LLYLHGDERFRLVPQAIHLNNERDVDDWFELVSEVLHQYGDELLRDKPGAFERLANAQPQRDANYVARMNAKDGE
jgi:hypothetical protein